MKKLFLLFFLLTSFSFSVFSQNKALEKYASAGEYHNKGLDYIKVFMTKENLSKFIDKDKNVDKIAATSYLIQLCNEYTSNNSVMLGSETITPYQVKDPNEFFNLQTEPNLYMECAKIDDKQKAIDCINELVNPKNESDNDFLLCTAIYLYSFEYWTNFSGVGNGTEAQKAVKINWWGAGYADVAGAYGGVALGPGGAIAFGLLGSANNLMLQCIFSLF
jgi:hypothetical protein